jgi:hypothetical protein
VEFIQKPNETRSTPCGKYSKFLSTELQKTRTVWCALIALILFLATYSSTNICIHIMSGIRFPARAKDFFLLNSIQTGSEAHPSTGHQRYCSRGRSGRGVKLIAHLCVDQEWWNSISTPLYVLMAWCLMNWTQRHGSVVGWEAMLQAEMS